MLQNANVAAFTVSGLLRENQQGWQNYPRHTQIRVNNPDFSRELTIFIISSISSFEILDDVVPDP